MNMTDAQKKDRTLQLRVGPKTVSSIERGMRIAEIDSKSEFVRQAIVFYRRALEFHQEGGNVVFEKGNGDRFYAIMD